MPDDDIKATEFIAHISGSRKQSVKDHCVQTAELAERYAAEFGCPALGRLAGITHDFGKMCRDFSDYILCEKFRKGDIEHSFAGARFVAEIAKTLPDENARNAAKFAAHAVIAHHGLRDWIDDCGGDYYTQQISKSERYSEIQKAVREEFDMNEISELLTRAGEEYTALREKCRQLADKLECKSSKRTAFAFYMGFAERLLESCLIDADRTDTANFMNGRKTSDEQDVKGLWNEMSNRLNKRLSGFSHDTEIKKRRADISARCAEFAKNNVGAVRLIVPTGGGKTLASLRFAIEYCKNHPEMKRIIYTAPFMSILDQNSREIREIAGEENFLEHHSNIFAQVLSDDSDKDNGDKLDHLELLCERWISPVIATTMVQLLNALFLGKVSALRRLHRLCGSVIIIDEVQSLPLKCVSIFNLAVNFLTQICGSVVVLCSATQPRLDECEFSVHFEGKGSMTGDYDEDFRIFHRTRLVPRLKKGGYSYEEAADFCMEKFRENWNLLLIVNTKKAAAEMYKLLCERSEGEETQLVHLSTNMCAAHRNFIIDGIRAALDEKRPIICVTTQLIEAGVDVSFNCVVRSLAGMDNAVQAAGRCNRHGADNCCDVYIIELGEEKLGNLSEITKAQTCSQTVLHGAGSADLLSPEIAEKYFRKYYEELENELDYIVKDGCVQTTLLNLLSLNAERVGVSDVKKGPHNQAFKTAGSLFRVIDKNTAEIIVPYDEKARNLIADLNGNPDSDELIKKHRLAQKYTVSVYPSMLKNLDENGGLLRLNSGALALREGFYDEKTGIVFNGEYNENMLW